uniref:hypothetical protein n=1 Tax=uncultured Bilophila sp. TaxID=529385 RepID=UPI0025F50C65|nr:hypothetical protein [uncultured Bilophila sp.]
MAIETPSWFDADAYYVNKAIQLKTVDPDKYESWNAGTVKDYFISNGIDPYQHFVDYGKAENVAPNSYFDANFYLRAKADWLNNYENEDGSLGFDGKDDWTAADVQKAFSDAGLTAWEHYLQFGTDEGVNPNETLDVQAYYEAKAAQLNETEYQDRTDWTADDVKEAFKEAGITAAQHAAAYAKAEEITVPGASDPMADESYDVYTGEITASTFTGTDAADKILVNGTALDIAAMGGDDQIIFSSGDTYTGEIDGGKDTDTLVIKADADVNLSGVTLTGVEALDMSAKGGQSVTLTGDQFVKDFANGTAIVASAKDGDTVNLSSAAADLIDATAFTGKLVLGSDVAAKVLVSQLDDVEGGKVHVDVNNADIKGLDDADIAKIDMMHLAGATMDISGAPITGDKVAFGDSMVQSVTMTSDQFGALANASGVISDENLTIMDTVTVKIDGADGLSGLTTSGNLVASAELIDNIVISGAGTGAAKAVDLTTMTDFDGAIKLVSSANAGTYDLTLSADQFNMLSSTTPLKAGSEVTIKLSDKADTVTLTKATDTVVFETNAGNNTDVIKGFTAGSGGDKLDFSSAYTYSKLIEGDNNASAADALSALADAAANGSGHLSGATFVFNGTVNELQDTIKSASGTAGTDWYLASGDSALAFVGNVVDGATTFSVYEVTGKGGDAEEIHLVGTVQVDHGTALDVANFA